MEQFRPQLNQQTLKQFLNLLLGFAIITAVFILMAKFLSAFPWDFKDWTSVYHAVGRSPLNPYDSTSGGLYLNPPWLAWLMVPFSVIPPKIALAAFMTLTILVTIWCVKKMGGGVYIALLSLLSPAFYRLFVHGQTDVIVLLGFVFMLVYRNNNLKSLGIILMLIKPQVLGLAIPVHWLGLDRESKLSVLYRIVLFFALSLIVHGLWLVPWWRNVQKVGTGANISIWPYGIPIGLILLAIGLRNNNARLSGMSTLFLVPYLNSSSLFPYTVVLFTSISKLWSTAIFILLWILAIVLS